MIELRLFIVGLYFKHKEPCPNSYLCFCLSSFLRSKSAGYIYKVLKKLQCERKLWVCTYYYKVISLKCYKIKYKSVINIQNNFKRSYLLVVQFMLPFHHPLSCPNLFSYCSPKSPLFLCQRSYSQLREKYVFL